MRELISSDILRKRAEEKIEQIYRNLKRNHSKILDMSLYSGKMGICLFFFYYEIFTGKKGNAKKILLEINDKISKKENCLDCSLWFSEFGWLLQHLKRIGFIDVDIEEIISEIDDVLQYTMIRYIEQDNYELIYGATNIANYFFLREWEGKNKCFDLFLETLYKKSINFDNNLTSWLSYVDISLKRKNEDQCVNLGIAHGIPALILFFSKLKEVGYSHIYLDELLNRSCNYVLSLEQDTSIYISHFNSIHLPNKVGFNTSRIAWCYGDLSVGFALLKAAKFNENLEKKAIQILIDTTKRRETAYVLDDSLCHGSIGIAHIYSRVYSLTKNVLFKEAALYWYKKGIVNTPRHNCAAGIGFYAGEKYVSNLCLLDGIAGIGLSLIFAVSGIEPSWDESFLLS